MTRWRILLACLLLSTPALACTNCLVSQCQFYSAVIAGVAVWLIGRYRQVQGWRAGGLWVGLCLLGTAFGVASNLVLQVHYALAPLVSAWVILTAVGMLGRFCPARGEVPEELGLTPDPKP